MECKMTQCENNAFGFCGVGCEKEYDEVIPNNDSCPSFYDVKKGVEDAKKGVIDYMIHVLEEIKFPYIQEVKAKLQKMNTKDLLQFEEKISELYQLHLTNEALDSILSEVEEIGPEAFKAKYELNA